MLRLGLGLGFVCSGLVLTFPVLREKPTTQTLVFEHEVRRAVVGCQSWSDDAHLHRVGQRRVDDGVTFSSPAHSQTTRPFSQHGVRVAVVVRIGRSTRPTSRHTYLMTYSIYSTLFTMKW